MQKAHLSRINKEIKELQLEPSVSKLGMQLLVVSTLLTSPVLELLKISKV